MATLETLNFNNLALCSLPVDNEAKEGSRRIEGACFVLTTPTPVSNPRAVAHSPSALSLLDLKMSELSRPEFEQYMSGNRLLPGSQSAAHCYCGHQCGYFSGQLGDGAAMYLGEVLNSRGKRWEVQLKGAGQTPFSNSKDGRKVLRSSIREFLCSEAMHHLGIPTTRGNQICMNKITELPVIFAWKDKYHTGTAVKERASLVLRIAPTFLRFGSFEIFKASDPLTGYQGPSTGNIGILHKLLDYTINNFFPQIRTKEFQNCEDCYLAFYKEVVLLTARLVADWQSVGFCHGVANTDNTSIIGITMDYGPFGFMDYYDPSYISQSHACAGVWLLFYGLSSFVFFIVMSSVILTASFLYQRFDAEFEERFHEKIRLKLGLLKKELSTDKDLIKSLFDTMEETGADFTNTFRFLSKVTPTSCTGNGSLGNNHKESVHSNRKRRAAGFFLLSYRRERLDQECDEQNFDQVNQERVKVMKANNPRFVLRNYIARNAVEAAENGDFSKVQNLLNRLQTPYSDFDDFSGGPATSDFMSHGTCQSLFHTTSNGNEVYLEKPPDDAVNMRLTCSS
ncbi:PREDICTED: selenoprotein O-like [Acropora digitifera]|uniref:selenoprotein O-like n=1 Tax=Acropora digitifera TaxID=70779 RepID=UPI00077A4E1F|nr:PREDICTED: selenoprotein O-like [Acropora digitifera]